jgi:23S rRNA pseudouridine1911/1915/1917 synthase
MNDDIKILYEDQYLIAVNKSATIPMQNDKTGDQSLIDLINSKLSCDYYIGPIHRLDRPVSGIVIFAKDKNILAIMNGLFKNHEVKKYYWAIVDNKPSKINDTIVHYITKNGKTNKSTAFDKKINNSKKAILKYRLVGNSKRYYFLEINLLTGRHHQIRAQLATIGCHIKGDIKYGFKRQNKDKSIHLHARKISFIHPVFKKEIVIIAEPPDEPLWNEFKRIIFD